LYRHCISLERWHQKIRLNWCLVLKSALSNIVTNDLITRRRIFPK
jgi:hypothetical protein